MILDWRCPGTSCGHARLTTISCLRHSNVRPFSCGYTFYISSELFRFSDEVYFCDAAFLCADVGWQMEIAALYVACEEGQADTDCVEGQGVAGKQFYVVRF